MAEDGQMSEGRLLLNAAASRRGWHLLSSGLTCPQQRKFDELRRAGIISVKLAGVLVRGSLVHIGAAHFYRRKKAVQDGEDPDRWHTPAVAVEMLRDSFFSETQPRNRDHIDWSAQLSDARLAVEELMRDSETRDRHLEIVSVEEQSVVRLRLDPWLPGKTQIYSQRQDLVVRDTRSGFYFSIDHKTRGRRDARTTRAYMRSGQFQGLQRFGFDKYGEQWGGSMINFVTMPSRGKPARIDRVLADVKPWRLRSFGATIGYGEMVWEKLESMNLDPYDYPKVMGDNGACEHRFGPCPFAEICDLGPDS